MLLAVDVGNTQTVLGLFEGSMLRCSWRIESDSCETVSVMEGLLSDLLSSQSLYWRDIDALVLASVIPAQRLLWSRFALDCLNMEALVVDESCLEGLLEVQAQGAGADRLANAVAASCIYGSPVIVVDMGTATDFEVVSAEGVFLGGAIAAGVKTSIRSLNSQTALLPEADLHVPGKAIGANTADAIKVGVVLGEVDRIDGLVRRMWNQLGYETPVVATGGLSGAVGCLCSCVTVINPDLTLQGLRLIYEHAAR